MSLPPRRKPRTAKLAEHDFQKMCSAAGVIGTKVGEDENGWDALVEFPSVDLGGPVDLNRPPRTSLVQIKSTVATDGHTCRLKVSNAVRFAQNELPCFVLLVVFADDLTEPSHFFLRHVWESDIRLALERGRNCSLAGKPPHRTTLTVNFTDAERCGKHEVIDRIEQAIESVPGYGARKAHLAATVGYEDSWGAGRFTLADGVSYDDLIDVLLGRARSVQLSDIEIHDTRFGTVGPRISPEGPAEFSVEAQPSDHCVVTLSAPKRGEALTLDGEVYTLGAKNVADEFQRFRIQADMLELIVKRNGEISAHGTIPVDRPLPIDRIERLAGLKSVLGAGEVEVEIFKDDLSTTGSITMEPDRHNYYWRRLHKVTGQLTDFLPPNRWPKGADLSAIEWFEAIEEGWKFASFVAESGNTLNFANPKPGFRALWDAADTYVGGIFIDLGKLTLFAMVKAPVELVDGDEARLDITLGQPAVIKRMAFRGPYEAHVESMQAAEAAAHKRFAGPTTVLASVMRMPISAGADEFSEDDED